jgi:hypothetical protein
MKVAALFEEEPRRWGLRGDPHLWHALRLRLADEDLPGSVEEVMDLVRAAFGELAGTDLDSAPENSAPENSAPEQMVYREQYAHGGMSSGWISLGTWREQLMPLIADRLDAAHGRRRRGDDGRPGRRAAVRVHRWPPADRWGAAHAVRPAGSRPLG